MVHQNPRYIFRKRNRIFLDLDNQPCQVDLRANKEAAQYLLSQIPTHRERFRLVLKDIASL